MTRSTALVVPAGGAGRRFGSVAKPFVLLRGQPLLMHALRPFLDRADVAAVVVVLPADIARDPPDWLVRLDPRITLIAGGEERFDSVHRGIEAVHASVDVIAVHDAARPLVTAAIVDRVLAAAYGGSGAIAGIAAVDTLHEVDDAGRVVATPPRSVLRQAQTPQAFPRRLLAEAYRRAADEGLRGTDEAAVVRRYGGEVTVVEGSRENIKVTVPADLALAELLLDARAGT